MVSETYSPEDIAIHEASHCLMMYRADIEIGEVSIAPDRTSLGRVTYAKGPPKTLTREQFPHWVMLYTAGSAGLLVKQAIQNTGQSAGSISPGDIDPVYIVARAFMTEEQFRHYMTRSTEQCARILSHPRIWAVVTAVAQSLLARTTIPGPDVEAMIRDVLGSREDLQRLA